MENISFKKTPEEIEKFVNMLNRSNEVQEGICVVWETDPKILKNIIPCPLTPAGPYVFALISYIYEADFWKDYCECILLVPVKYEDIEYSYYLGMSIAGKNDMPIFLGRECLGFPKKMADSLTLYRSGDDIKGSVKRNGINFFHVDASIGKCNDPIADVIFDNYKIGSPITGKNINFQYDFDCQKSPVGFSNVRLVTSEATNIYSSIEKAEIKNIVMVPSRDDPWAELKVKKMLGAIYYKTEVIMGPAKKLMTLDEKYYAPYLFARWDSSTFGYNYRSFHVTK